MKKVIEEFVNNSELAIAGVSSDPKKWGNMLYRELTKKGYTVYPVNPKLDEAEGTKCYHSVSDLPDHIENLILATPPSATEAIVRECKDSGIKRIWMHQGGGGTGAHSDDAEKYVREHNMELVHGFCPMMFFPPTGIHKIHLWFKKISGKVPAEYN